MALKAVNEEKAAEALVPFLPGGRMAQESNVAGGMPPQEKSAGAGGPPPSDGAGGPPPRMAVWPRRVMWQADAAIGNECRGRWTAAK